MDTTTTFQNRQGQSTKTLMGQVATVGGWDVQNPYLLAGYEASRTQEQIDAISLNKLWETGFSVDTLDEAMERYKIVPIRLVEDIWKILSYQNMPGGTREPRYGEKCLTSLALFYPNPAQRGEVYEYQYFVRVRHAEAIAEYSRNKGKIEKHYRRYDQPVKDSTKTSSEPYYLCSPEVWDRIMDPTVPLWITEGELKAASLCLAGKAAIGFGGATMWMAPQKSGKHRIHPALDPKGNRSKWAIPILGRAINLVPDMDYRVNLMVRKTFFALAAAMYTAGSKVPKLIDIPDCDKTGDWKGIDDYLCYYLGKRWSGSPEKIEDARSLLAQLESDRGIPMRMNDIRYKATTVVRGVDRFHERFRTETRHMVRLVDGVNNNPIGWAVYNGQQYRQIDCYQTIGNTNGKYSLRDDELKMLAIETYEEGVDLLAEEGEADKPEEMPSDYPNKLAGLLDVRLPKHTNDTLIEPFGNVRPDDRLVRTRNSLMNMTRFFDLDTPEVAWDRREEWMLPPNYRWVSTGCLETSLAGLDAVPECPIFLELLNNAFSGDQERMRTLQLFMGKVVCNPIFMGMQQFLALYGQPGSGKGTIARVLLSIIGPSAVLEMRAQLGNRFETGSLPGKKLLLFHETPDEGRTGNFNPHMADIVKSITGQDRVMCERKGVDAKPYFINAEIIIIGETPPVLPMHEFAFRRRAIFCGMTNAIAKRDFLIEEKMHRTELPGILWWALQGAHSLWRDGRTIITPAHGQEDLDDVTTDVSPIDKFVNECVEVKEDGVLFISDLRDRFDRWCADMQLMRLVGGSAAKKVSFRIRAKYNKQSTTRYNAARGNLKERCYLGIALKEKTAY